MLENFQKMSKLESQFDDKVNLVQPNRILVNSYLVQTQRQKFTLIIFSDELWVTKPSASGRLTSPKKVPYVDLDVYPFGERSVFLSSSSDSIYGFETRAFRDSFLSEFRKTSIANQQLRRSQLQLDWEVKPMSKKLELVDHSMVIVADTIWMYGGRDRHGIVQGVVRKVGLTDRQLFVRAWNEATDPIPRYSAALCGVEEPKHIYMFGGTPNGEELFGDFWCFDIETCRWTEIRHPHTPPPGKGLSLVQMEPDLLLLSGGVTKFEVFHYRISTQSWSQIVPEKGPPFESLIDHSVLPLLSWPGCALIHGGRNLQGDFQNALVMMANRGQNFKYLKSAGLSPMNRLGSHLFLVEKIVYCFGGDDEVEVPFALTVGVFGWRVPSNRLAGGQIPSMTRSAMAQSSGKIFLHGGRTANGKIHSQLYEIVPKVLGVDERPSTARWEPFDHVSCVWGIGNGVEEPWL
jgi:hypothetical protein